MSCRSIVKLISPNSTINYATFLSLQNSLVERKLKTYDRVYEDDYVMLMEHDKPVFTAGRRNAGFSASKEADILRQAGASVIDSNRGGQLTWHGPGQLCLYPILDLRRHTPNMHMYVERLEEVLIRTCREFGLETQRGRDRSHEVGVWTADKHKIGFIGIRNSKWITSFGISLNVSPDLSWFDKIEPCGLSSIRVTSLKDSIHRFDTNISIVGNGLLDSFASVFDCNLTLDDKNRV